MRFMCATSSGCGPMPPRMPNTHWMKKRRLHQAAVGEVARACTGGRCRSTRSRSACRCRAQDVRMYSMSLNVFLKMRSSEPSRYGRSQSCLNSLKRSSIGKRPKFIEPMLSEATSGLKVAARAAAAPRSSSSARRPVVMLTTHVGALLDLRQERRERLRALVGPAVLRDRAHADARWPRPPRAAPIAASAISCGVTGRCGDIDGVWIEPVTAQVMMTLRAAME